MILQTPDHNELMKVQRIEREGDHLVIHGVIMESIPTKAILLPGQIRAGFSLLNLKLVWNVLVLLFK